MLLGLGAFLVTNFWLDAALMVHQGLDAHYRRVLNEATLARD